MPSPNESPDTGSVKTQEFATRFPGVATVIAQQTNSEAGSSADVGTTIMSDPGQERIGQLFNGEDGAFDDLLNFEVPETAGKSQEEATKTLFGAAEESIRGEQTAKRTIFSRLEEASGTLDRLTAFNKATYTKKRLKELDPTSEIDEQINELRQQMFVEDIRLDNDPELNLMTPAQRTSVRAAGQEKFINAITELGQQRNARLKAAQGQIDDEIGANDDQINASSARVNALTRTLESIIELGKDNEALVSIRMDLVKEQERLKKLRKGAGGASGGAYSTQKEMAKIQLRQKFLDEGRPINEAEIDAIIEAHFLKAVGPVSVIGKRGEETQTVDVEPIGTSPEFEEPLTTPQRVAALGKIDKLEKHTLEAIGAGDENAGRKILLESL